MAKKIIALAVCVLALLAFWAVRTLDEDRTPSLAGVSASPDADLPFRSTNWNPKQGERTVPPRSEGPVLSDAPLLFDGVELAVPIGEAR